LLVDIRDNKCAPTLLQNGGFSGRIPSHVENEPGYSFQGSVNHGYLPPPSVVGL
jgi:hypothetical protein